MATPFTRRGLFAGALTAPALVGSKPAPSASAARGGPKVGCQEGPTSDEWLRFFARHGIRNICGMLPPRDDPPFTVDELSALRDRCNKQGISLDMMTEP